MRKYAYALLVDNSKCMLCGKCHEEFGPFTEGIGFSDHMWKDLGLEEIAERLCTQCPFQALVIARR